MHKNARRILEAMHKGYVLCEDHCFREYGESDWYIMSWTLDRHDTPEGGRGDYTEVEVDETPDEYRKKFSYDRFDDLNMDGLIDKTPDTRSNRRVCLTPDGLAKAQELFGQIMVPVPVVYENDGVYLVLPVEGTAATERSILLRDDPQDEEQFLFREIDWAAVSRLIPERYSDQRMNIVTGASPGTPRPH